LAALCDVTRRDILASLKSRPASVTELARPFEMSQQAISKHLAYLERAGLIKKRRNGRQQVCYLNPEPLGEVANWVEQYRQHWEEAFNRLDGLLHEVHQRKATRRKHS
jgi:DNA-binding transcriptional ArsR family regulator